MNNELLITGLVIPLVGTIIWVVKRVFDFSDRHIEVIENNTKSTDALNGAMGEISRELRSHALSAEPAHTATVETLVILKSITETLAHILDTQKEILHMVQDLHPGKI